MFALYSIASNKFSALQRKRAQCLEVHVKNCGSALWVHELLARNVLPRRRQMPRKLQMRNLKPIRGDNFI